MVREFLAVVVRAALQWALASLLLANGAAFCLIAAMASALRLGPPCLLCARVHRLLGSSSASAADGSSSHEHEALRRLLCEAHVAAVAGSVGSRPEQRLQKTCSPSDHVDGRRRDDSHQPGGLEAHRAVSIGSEICEQDRGSDQDVERFERSSSIGNEGPYVSLFELAPIASLPADQDNPPELDDSTPEPLKRELSMPSSVTLQAGGGEDEEDKEERDLITVSGLAAELRAQRKELEAAGAELEAERCGKAEAVEQGELDREAVRLAMQLVHEAEAEKHGLQRRLDACRVKAQLYDAAMDASALGDGGDLPEPEAGGNGGNNYQSLVDFFPGSAVYSSSPDLANLLKLYTEGNGGGRRRSMESVMDDASAVAEEEELVAVVAVAAVSDSNGGNVQATGIDGASL